MLIQSNDGFSQVSLQAAYILAFLSMAPFGFINCDKPVGMTSRDVVNIVSGCLRKSKDGTRTKKKFKVGHAGTLDPLAEGVLVVGVGRAVRLVPYVHSCLAKPANLVIWKVSKRYIRGCHARVWVILNQQR